MHLSRSAIRVGLPQNRGWPSHRRRWHRFRPNRQRFPLRHRRRTIRPSPMCPFRSAIRGGPARNLGWPSHRVRRPRRRRPTRRRHHRLRPCRHRSRYGLRRFQSRSTRASRWCRGRRRRPRDRLSSAYFAIRIRAKAFQATRGVLGRVKTTLHNKTGARFCYSGPSGASRVDGARRSPMNMVLAARVRKCSST